MLRTLGVAASIVALAACVRVEQDPSKRSAEIVIADGARSLRHGAALASEGSSYEVTMPYPPEAFLATVAERLEALGWAPASVLSDDPRIPTAFVRGWTEYLDATVKPPVKVASWIGEWRRGSQVVRYTLRYETAGRDVMNVWITLRRR